MAKRLKEIEDLKKAVADCENRAMEAEKRYKHMKMLHEVTMKKSEDEAKKAEQDLEQAHKEIAELKSNIPPVAPASEDPLQKIENFKQSLQQQIKCTNELNICLSEASKVALQTVQELDKRQECIEAKTKEGRRVKRALEEMEQEHVAEVNKRMCLEKDLHDLMCEKATQEKMVNDLKEQLEIQKTLVISDLEERAEKDRAIQQLSETIQNHSRTIEELQKSLNTTTRSLEKIQAANALEVALRKNLQAAARRLDSFITQSQSVPWSEGHDQCCSTTKLEVDYILTSCVVEEETVEETVNEKPTMPME